MNAESVKARLKNFAMVSGHTFQEALTYYGLERTIYRISISPYADHFILKGGIFLYAIFDKKYERATTDIDLLARRISNSGEEMMKVFNEIFSQNVDDALDFDIDSMTVEDITEFKEYHGLRISIMGYLNRTKVPVSIDIGFGDVIYPRTIEMEFPAILEDESPIVHVYSLESVIAEKLEAIISNGYFNSRYKDFYDIYVLSHKYVFSYSATRQAVMETFEHRGTMMTMRCETFDNLFVQDMLHQRRWNSFLKKKRAMKVVSLEEMMCRLVAFAKPLLEGSGNENSNWDPDMGLWT